MKGMTVLKRCRAAEGDMARIRLRIQRRREAMECITPRMDVTGSRSTAEPDKMGAFVAAITELEADLKARELARSAEVAAACVDTGSVYFAAVGGAAAFLAKCVESSQTISYDDLGTEALRLIVVRDFPVFVGIDVNGACVYDR